MDDDRTPVHMAYEGDPNCMSFLCRRWIDYPNPMTPGCIGWHCAVCHEPSSQYGHTACHETPVNP